MRVLRALAMSVNACIESIERENVCVNSCVPRTSRVGTESWAVLIIDEDSCVNEALLATSILNGR